MAIAGLTVKVGKKGAASAHANYVSRTGQYEKYLERGEVLEATGTGNLPAWAEHDPSLFWQAADAYERANGSAYREFQISLPRELNSDERLSLVESFIEAEIGDAHAYQYAIHVPKAADGLDNPHVHLMFSERRVDGIDRDPDAYFKRYNAREPEKGGARKGFGEQPGAKLTRSERSAELKVLRDRWEGLVNDALERAGSTERISMKSYRDRGLDIQPEPKQLPSAWRKGSGKAAILAFREARAAELDERLDPSSIIESVSAQQSVFSRQDLYRALSKVTDDRDAFAAIKAELDVHPTLVPVAEAGVVRGTSSERLTTVEAIRADQSVVALGAALVRGSVKGRGFGLAESAVDRALSAVASRSFALSEEQAGAVRHVSGDERLSLVSGVAGAGKSTMLSVVRDAYESAGFRVSGMALAGKAADELTHSSGINARTIASWLYRVQQGSIELTSKDVVVVDEAGMVNNGLMERVLDAVNQAGAKAILVGDAEQLQPIEAGVPFLSYCSEHGAADITQVRRQREEWQREATQALSMANGREALAAYEKAGCVHEGKAETLVAPLVDRYLSKPLGSSVILAHRRVDVAMLNEAVRSEREARGELGEAVAFGGALELAVGDRVVFTKNDTQLDVRNGQFGTVVGMKGDQIVVHRDDGTGVQFSAKEYSDLQHGYASTIHKSQGMTVEHAQVWGSASLDRHLLYVAMSRHRETLAIYQSDEATRVRSLEACAERSNRADTVGDVMATHGLKLVQSDAGQWSLEARYPSAAEVDAAKAELASIRESAREAFGEEESTLKAAVSDARAELASHQENEPSANVLKLLKPSALAARQAWEDKGSALERAVEKASRALSAWEHRVDQGEGSEEKQVFDAVHGEGKAARAVVAADKDRLKDEQAVREFGAIEKQLESPLKRADQRQLVKEQQALALKLSKGDSGGLLAERVKAVAKEPRAAERSRGGLEL